MTESETKQQACIHARTKIQNGYEVCTDCGLIFDQEFSNQESRIYDENQAKTKIIRSIVLAKNGYRTIFDSNRDINGKMLDPKCALKFYRLQRIQKSATTTIERDMAQYCTVIPKICSDLVLSNTDKLDIENVFISAINHGFSRGRSLDATLAASVFTVARMKKLPISIDEILSVLHLSYRSRRLMMAIYREIKAINDRKFEPKIISIHDYITKYGNFLNFPEPMILKAYSMYDFLVKHGFESTGKDPSGIAIAIIYVLSKWNGMHITQKKAASITKITEVTIRTRLKEIMVILTPILKKKGMV